MWNGALLSDCERHAERRFGARVRRRIAPLRALIGAQCAQSLPRETTRARSPVRGRPQPSGLSNSSVISCGAASSAGDS
jgi:hypothetical protein